MRSPLISIIFLLVTLSGALAQGVTTSSITGKVVDAGGNGLPGTTIIAIHTSSGTQYGIVSDNNGFFRIPNMRIGGPYKVNVSFIGFNTFERNDIFLTLGQTYKLDVVLAESSTELAEIIVSADVVFDGDRTGQKTIVDNQTINALPTVSRSIADFARFNPLANIQQGTDGFSISLAGQNNRYNAIYIDGAINNDVFGLAGSGTNGGQTGVQPISLDAIEQFQISVSPFDVRQSGFSGGSINAVTRSGTNSVEGSAYYLIRNESLSGKTPVDIEGRDRVKLNPYTAKTYGFRLGGPILKDKIFFFINGEIQRDETPQPFDFSTYEGSSDAAVINSLRNKIKSYNYDPLGFENNTAFLNSNKILAKFDFNISEKHKLTIRHSYVKAENLEARNSTTTRLNFLNGSEYFVSSTNSSALELKSTFGNKFANKLVLGTTFVRDDRDPFGNPFPTVTIADGPGAIEFGAERFSTANLLNQDIITLTNDFEIYKGKHTITLGTHNEYYKVGNLFMRNNFGSYSYDNVNEFLNNINTDTYERTFSQVDNVTGDASKAIAAFKGYQLGLYAQDDYQVNDVFKLTFGLRFDLPIFPDAPRVNDDLNNNAIPAIELQGYDLLGAKTGSFIDPQLMISPRVGFNWDAMGNRSLQIRGGAGIFTSRVPLVWPGGAYNNFGFNIGGVRVTNRSVPFNPDVNAQFPVVDLNNPLPSGQIDLFAADFKLPQVFKASLGFDQSLPWGLVGTLEGIYTKTLNNVRYQNLNLRPSVETLTGTPDNRPIFVQNNRIYPTYQGIFLASNTSKGYSYNIVAQLAKNFQKGFSANLAYTYGDSYSINDGTSSQNNSQWQGNRGIKGRNEEGELGRSIYSVGSRIIAQLSYKKEYLGFAASQISLFYNGQSGQAFSYVVGGESFTKQLVNDGGFTNSNLIYVPANQGEIILVNKPVIDKIYTPAEQWEVLNRIIENDKHLSDRRGNYAQRNMGRTPFESILDFRFLQEFYLEMANNKRNTIQVSVDIFNLSNFLNKDWGRRYFLSNNNFGVIEFAGFQPGTKTPTYTVNTKLLEGQQPWENNIIDSGFRSSRWQMQVGVRYIFGN